jgi:hypothetical protein
MIRSGSYWGAHRHRVRVGCHAPIAFISRAFYSLLCAFCCLYTTICQQLVEMSLQPRNVAGVRVGCAYI